MNDQGRDVQCVGGGGMRRQTGLDDSWREGRRGGVEDEEQGRGEEGQKMNGAHVH